MTMTDLETTVNSLNELLKNHGITQVFCTVGKRAPKWFCKYAGTNNVSYSISKQEADNYCGNSINLYEVY
jgi:hypothetical protein